MRLHGLSSRIPALWPLFAIAFAVVVLSLLAGRAQAGPDPEAAAGTQAQSRGAAGELDLPAREPRPRISIGKAEAMPERQALGQVRNAAGEPLELSDDACEANVRLAASKGLRLPDDWAIHCIGPGLDWEGGSHWGVTCPYTECPEGRGPYVSISNPTYYVVAHELCHANFGNDELMADSCAAEHGASLETSPYQ
jgi:hypothetical protein